MTTPSPSLSADFVRHAPQLRAPRNRSDLLREEFDLQPSPARRQARLFLAIALVVLAALLGTIAAQAVLIVAGH